MLDYILLLIKYKKEHLQKYNLRVSKLSKLPKEIYKEDGIEGGKEMIRT